MLPGILLRRYSNIKKKYWFAKKLERNKNLPG